MESSYAVFAFFALTGLRRAATDFPFARVAPFFPLASSESAPAIESMKANQMPPVENFFDWLRCKKAPLDGAFSEWKRTLSGGFRHVCGLGSFLTLNYLELDLIALCERFETRPTDRAEMDKDVRATLA
jgi:hypothetical protein